MSAPAVDLAQVHEAAATRLRTADQLYTHGRRALVEALVAAERPSTIPELLALGPTLTQSSVYRNLAMLEEVGVVQKVVSTDDRARFELAEDLMGHHHHLICTNCGRVDDFRVAPATEEAVESALAAAIGDNGFRPTGHRLDVVGTCADCT